MKNITFGTQTFSQHQKAKTVPELNNLKDNNNVTFYHWASFKGMLLNSY